MSSFYNTCLFVASRLSVMLFHLGPRCVFAVLGGIIVAMSYRLDPGFFQHWPILTVGSGAVVGTVIAPRRAVLGFLILLLPLVGLETLRVLPVGFAEVAFVAIFFGWFLRRGLWRHAPLSTPVLWTTVLSWGGVGAVYHIARNIPWQHVLYRIHFVPIFGQLDPLYRFLAAFFFLVGPMLYIMLFDLKPVSEPVVPRFVLWVLALAVIIGPTLQLIWGTPEPIPGPFLPFRDVHSLAQAVLALLFVFALHTSASRRCVSWSVSAVLALVLLVSQSRGAWLAALFPACLLGGRTSRLRRRVFYPAGAVLGIIVCVFIFSTFGNTVPVVAELRSRIREAVVMTGLVAPTEEDRVPGQSMAERFTLWGTACRNIAEYPVCGIGAGAFYGKSVDSVAVNSRHENVHNYALQLAVEQGIPVALIFFVTCFCIIRTGLRTGHEFEYGAAVGMAAVLLMSLVTHSLILASNALIFWTVAATASSESPVASPKTIRAVVVATLGLVVLAIVFVSPPPAFRGVYLPPSSTSPPVYWTMDNASMRLKRTGNAIVFFAKAPVTYAPNQTVTVTFSADRTFRTMILTDENFHRVCLPLSPSNTPAVTLNITTDWAFIPSSVVHSQDDRRLGVSLTSPTVVSDCSAPNSM